MSEEIISWSAGDMLEVTISQPDDFLKIRETLTRIGVASRKDKTLYQSCHILHKQGKYYITHFKELFALDGKKIYSCRERYSKKKYYRSITTRLVFSGHCWQI